MTKPIHHAILKRAQRLGVTIIEANDAFRLSKGNRLTQNAWESAKEALDDYAADAAGKPNPNADPIAWDIAKAGYCGVMAASYHDRYEHNVHGPGSCDGLDCALRDAYTHEDTGTDVQGLFELGRKHDLWNEAWEGLNPGMKRMNLSNRLRAYLRNHADATITIAGITGRFGVAYRPAKGRAKKSLALAA